MSCLVGWKLWYSNDAKRVVFSSKDGLFVDAPSDKVIDMVVFYKGLNKENPHQLTRQMFGGNDWYFHDDKELFGSNNDTKVSNILRYPNCSFKRGIWVSRTEMELIDRAVLDDRGDGWL